MKRALYLVWLILPLTGSALAQNLSLENYLGQVKAGPDYARALTNRQVTDLNRLSLGRHWSGNLNFSASRDSYNNYVWDYTQNQYVTYSQDTFNYDGSLNFNNTWDFGLSTGLNYNLNHNDYWNTTYPYPSDPTHSTYDNLSLTAGIPLWQNFLGEETRAGDKRDRLSSDASVDSNEYQIQSVLLSAKQTYYTLAAIRAETALRTELLSRLGDLAALAKRRSPEDSLQAQSALENQQQVLEHLEDNERAWRNQFNRYRGKDGSQVDETLQTLDELSAAATQAWPGGEPDRLDLEASRLYLQSQIENNKFVREDLKLPLSLSGSLGGNLLHDNDPNSGSFIPYPQPLIDSYSLGLNFSVPFDFFTNLWDVNARRSKIQLAQTALDLKETENLDSQVWEDMTLRYQKSTGRIEQAGELEAHKKELADKSLGLLKAGRLGMFETLSFQDQALSAALNRNAWLSDRLNLIAQAELYQAKRQATADR